MAKEKRLIKVVDATKVYNGIALYMAENAYLNDTALDVLKMVANWLNEAPTVDAVEVVHGHWKEYSHSALVRWKDGEPVWADRSVFRCSRCDFGTIAKHNYCPRCGAKMDGGNEDV